MKQKWQCKIARSLGDGFAGTFYDAWGVVKYTNPEAPTVFVGMYGLPDYCNFRSHRGRKMIFWCGSDLRYFAEGWWIDDKGKQRVNPKDFVPYLKKFENWVENSVEADLLKKFGIKAKIAPSFLGDVNKFKPEFYYKIGMYPHYYSSVSGNDFKLYGWDKINKLAKQYPNWTIHLYGNTVPWKAPKNVIVRGRVSQETMDNEIKKMTGAIRLIPLEGFSEVICKAILWNQDIISAIPYKYTRESLLRVLNKYPWQTKK